MRVRRIDRFTLEARDKDGRIGIIKLMQRRDVEKGLVVADIEVAPQLQRQRIGTALYERAARVSCEEFDGPLMSAKARTRYSQAFWEKQTAKGRAKCMVESTERETAFPEGWPMEMAIQNRGGCRYYALRCPAPKSLAGKSVR